LQNVGLFAVTESQCTEDEDDDEDEDVRKKNRSMIEFQLCGAGYSNR
jgi:hypothetical protein